MLPGHNCLGLTKSNDSRTFQEKILLILSNTHKESNCQGCICMEKWLLIRVGTEWDRACLIVGVMQVIVSGIGFQYFALVEHRRNTCNNSFRCGL